MKTQLTAERLRELLHYCPDTGRFTWRIELRHGRGRVFARPGDQAGAIDRQTNYLRIGIDYGKYHGHRLAWLYVHGHWPFADIDHINGDRSDNRLVNLRDVSHRVNLQNRRKANAGSKSGALGVYLVPSGRWVAKMTGPNGKPMHIGTYNAKDEAINARANAARRLLPGWTL